MPTRLDYERRQHSQQRQPRLFTSRKAVVLVALICGGLVLFVYITLPPFGRAREPANRIKCASNLKQIGLGAIMYANNHGNHFPDDFQTLLQDQELAPAMFNCPSSSDVPASGPTTRAVLSDLKKPGHVSYIYVGTGLLVTAPADVVLAYEPLTNHGGAGMNVLFVDGHVEWLSAAAAQTILKQATARALPIHYPLPAAAAHATQ